MTCTVLSSRQFPILLHLVIISKETKANGCIGAGKTETTN